MFEVIFDIETKNWFSDTNSSDPSGLGVSIVSVYFRELDSNLLETSGTMTSFWENEIPDMWHLFRQADRIIGFNSLGFDVPVLRPLAPSDFSTWSHFDIYKTIKDQNLGKAAGLDAIAKDTLGTGKIDSGENAIMYWRKGDPESLALLKKYCEADVEITKNLYDFALKHSFLKFTDRWNTPRTVQVDFSYPKDYASQKQVSLF